MVPFSCRLFVEEHALSLTLKASFKGGHCYSYFAGIKVQRVEELIQVHTTSEWE